MSTCCLIILIDNHCLLLIILAHLITILALGGFGSLFRLFQTIQLEICLEMSFHHQHELPTNHCLTCYSPKKICPKWWVYVMVIYPGRKEQKSIFHTQMIHVVNIYLHFPLNGTFVSTQNSHLKETKDSVVQQILLLH